MTTLSTVKKLLNYVGLDASLTAQLYLSESSRPAAPSSFAVGHLAQTTIAASALSAAHLHQVRGGSGQSISVDERHATLEFVSEKWTVTDGNPVGSLWDPLAGAYATSDGHVRIHTNFPHHRAGIISILGCKTESREAIAEALLSWRAEEFETAAAEAGLCVSALRSFEQWDSHPQAKALANTNAVQIIKVADGPPRSTSSHGENIAPVQPLEGIRVLDLTRIIAGPVCGRTLGVQFISAHGADVLHVTSPNLPNLPTLEVDTTRGKRTTQLDLNVPPDREKLEELIKEADVFLQAYRPGALENKGFGVSDVFRMRPGIVYASLRAYGWDGPWADRRGFDSLTQTSTGLNVAEAEAFNSLNRPEDHVPLKALPVQALDHAAGQLLVLGINAALARTYTEGGSYEVRVSLAAVSSFLRSLSRIPPSVAFPLKARSDGTKSASDTPGPEDEPTANIAMSLPARDSAEIRALSAIVPFARSDVNADALESIARDGAPKTLVALRHAAVMSLTPGTPVRVGEAPRGLNVHRPEWLPRSQESHRVP